MKEFLGVVLLVATCVVFPLTAECAMVVKPDSLTEMSPTTDLRQNPTDARRMLDRINFERKKVGLSALTENARMVAIARARNDDMIANHYVAHLSPSGVDLRAIVTRLGYARAYLDIGENIQFNTMPTIAGVMDDLMAHPSHRANILGANYTEVGISIYEGTYEGSPVWFVTQIFGQPRP